MPQSFIAEYRYTATPGEAAEQVRPQHIAYRKGLGGAMVLAGPLLDDAGGSTGSLMIFQALDATEAQTIASSDPYIGAGVTELVSLRPMRVAAVNPIN